MDFERQGAAPHGQKRRAQEELANDQRLIKRFNLLNLDHNGKLYTSPDSQRQPAGTEGYEEQMQLDDTKDKVYVYNLDDELKAADDDEDKVVFLPDIERKLNKIPKSVLTGHRQPTANSEMILYRVPSSLTVSEDQDSVRKAIIESRARVRQKQAEEARLIQQSTSATPPSNSGLWAQEYNNKAVYAEDEDAMDLG